MAYVWYTVGFDSGQFFKIFKNAADPRGGARPPRGDCENSALGAHLSVELSWRLPKFSTRESQKPEPRALNSKFELSARSTRNSS